MNLLTIDLEEWYLEKILHGGRIEKYHSFDETLDRLLADLEAQSICATFFCLGKMASDYPEVVRRIATKGHDIACHSNEHKWLTTLTPEALRQDTLEAIHRLEDLCGKKVTGFRAPAFSITPDNAWAIEVLGECGIETDSSVFPASRDFGGFPSFGGDTPCRISYGGVTLKEFPITISRIALKQMAFSGGGYFRLLPYSVIRKEMAKRKYNIGYFHLADLIPEQKKMMSREQYESYFKQPGSLKNRLTRYVKSNIGFGDTLDKMERMIQEFPFISMAEADHQIEWEKTRIVALK